MIGRHARKTLFAGSLLAMGFSHRTSFSRGQPKYHVSILTCMHRGTTWTGQGELDRGCRPRPSVQGGIVAAAVWSCGVYQGRIHDARDDRAPVKSDLDSEPAYGPLEQLTIQTTEKGELNWKATMLAAAKES